MDSTVPSSRSNSVARSFASSLISSIESAIQKGKVGIGAIDDFTSDHVEIELITSRGVSAEEVLPQLYAHTDCEAPLTSNILLIRNGRPIEVLLSNVISLALLLFRPS